MMKFKRAISKSIWNELVKPQKLKVFALSNESETRRFEYKPKGPQFETVFSAEISCTYRRNVRGNLRDLDVDGISELDRFTR